MEPTRSHIVAILGDARLFASQRFSRRNRFLRKHATHAARHHRGRSHPREIAHPARCVEDLSGNHVCPTIPSLSPLKSHCAISEVGSSTAVLRTRFSTCKATKNRAVSPNPNRGAAGLKHTLDFMDAAADGQPFSGGSLGADVSLCPRNCPIFPPISRGDSWSALGAIARVKIFPYVVRRILVVDTPAHGGTIHVDRSTMPFCRVRRTGSACCRAF